MKRTLLGCILMFGLMMVACGRPETPTKSAAKPDAPPAGGAAPAPAAQPHPDTSLTPEQILSERLKGYEARALDGSTFRIADQKGKVVLVNAWATWCGPCRYEIPELKRLHQEYADDGLVIAGVSVDMAGAEPAVRQFAKMNDIGYPILLDPQSRVTAMLRSTSIPTSVMIDREGNVVWRHIGIVSEQRDSTFRAALSKALGS